MKIKEIETIQEGKSVATAWCVWWCCCCCCCWSSSWRDEHQSGFIITNMTLSEAFLLSMSDGDTVLIWSRKSYCWTYCTITRKSYLQNSEFCVLKSTVENGADWVPSLAPLMVMKTTTVKSKRPRSNNQIDNVELVDEDFHHFWIIPRPFATTRG